MIIVVRELYVILLSECWWVRDFWRFMIGDVSMLCCCEFEIFFLDCGNVLWVGKGLCDESGLLFLICRIFIKFKKMFVWFGLRLGVRCLCFLIRCFFDGFLLWSYKCCSWFVWCFSEVFVYLFELEVFMRVWGFFFVMVYFFMVLFILFIFEVLVIVIFVCEEWGGYSVDFSWYLDCFLGF